MTTQTGNEISLSLGSYKYEEPGLMSLKGLKSGIELRATKAYSARLTFLRGELRYAGGTVDYSSNSTGSSSGEPDWYFEGRALIGRDWLLKTATISTYTGLGYRFLLNDGRGITSTGHAGYRRESTYIYLPVGIIFRTGLHSGDEMLGSLEYDHLLSGNQFSKLSDAGLGYSDLDSKQTEGYGMKLRLSYVTARWSAGPYLHYWNIAESNHNTIVRYGVPTTSTGWEPHNKTTEIGLELRHPF
ncbi:hypothetical protein [Sideroxydans sp.]